MHYDLSENLRYFKTMRQEEDISTLKIQSKGMWSTEGVLLLDFKTTTTPQKKSNNSTNRSSGL